VAGEKCDGWIVKNPAAYILRENTGTSAWWSLPAPPQIAARSGREFRYPHA